MRPAAEGEKTCPCVVLKNASGPQYPIRDGSRCKLYWCVGCKTYQPMCCGGAPDQRCDTCVSDPKALLDGLLDKSVTLVGSASWQLIDAKMRDR